MKHTSILFACLLALTASSTTADAQMRRNLPRQTLTLSFGQKKVQMEAPKNMCFLDMTNAAQNSLIADLRLQSWKTRKYVVMTVFADCREMANMGINKDMNMLSRIGIIRWMNPEIGPSNGLDLDAYLTMREVAFRSNIANDLTQFRSVTLDKEARRLDHAIAIGYLGKSEIESQPYNTVGVDATTSIKNIPVDITIMQTTSTLDKASTDTEPFYDLMSEFVEQQIFLNKEK